MKKTVESEQKHVPGFSREDHSLETQLAESFGDGVRCSEVFLLGYMTKSGFGGL